MGVLVIDGNFIVKRIEHLQNINDLDSDNYVWGVIRSVIHNIV